MEKYRPNVAALILDPDGRLLVCERRHFEGAWQFPQGGVDDGEDVVDALKRELVEEVGLSEEFYRIGRSKGGYRYRFPSYMSSKKSWPYQGQQQTYFECLLNEVEPALELGGEQGEFRDYKWIQPADFKLAWLPDFKMDVYFKVMKDFFGVEIR